MGKKKYFTEEERIDAIRESKRRWAKKHKKEISEYGKQWKEAHPEYFNQYYQNNKEKIYELNKQYRQTPIGRATNLLQGYRQNDKKYNRGECTLTAEWIVANIFPKPCHWCGEVGWEIMGCDRIDNALPHTPDNVNPCCEPCNLKRGTMTYDEYKNALRAKETTL